MVRGAPPRWSPWSWDWKDRVWGRVSQAEGMAGAKALGQDSAREETGGWSTAPEEATVQALPQL